MFCVGVVVHWSTATGHHWSRDQFRPHEIHPKILGTQYNFIEQVRIEFYSFKVRTLRGVYEKVAVLDAKYSHLKQSESGSQSSVSVVTAHRCQQGCQSLTPLIWWNTGILFRTRPCRDIHSSPRGQEMPLKTASGQKSLVLFRKLPVLSLHQFRVCHFCMWFHR